MNEPEINRDQRLYVFRSGNGYSYLGFDVVADRAQKFAEWLRVTRVSDDPPDPAFEVGSIEMWRAYRWLEADVLSVCKKRNIKCRELIDPRLRAAHGTRVRIVRASGDEERCWVGESTGPIPCALSVPTIRSSGGFPLYVGKDDTVEVLYTRGYADRERLKRRKRR